MWLKFRPEKTLHVNQITDWILFGVLSMLIALNALNRLSEVLAKGGPIAPRDVSQADGHVIKSP
jgi:hypothetical protein